MTAAVYKCPKCHIASHHPEDVANFYCGRCHLSAEDLRNEEVTMFKHLSRTYLTRRDCFSLAILALFDSGNPNARLVHGWCISSFTGEPVEHAWCEMPAIGICEDGSQVPIIVSVDYSQIDEHARIYPADLIYERIGAHNLKRFTLAEAVALALEAGHDGPWPSSPSRRTENAT